MKAYRFADNYSRHGFISIILGKLAEFIERGTSSDARGLYSKNDHIRMKAAAVLLSLSLILAGVSLLPVTSHQAYSPSTTHKASTSIAAEEAGLPPLQGEEAVEYLKQQGLYSSLEDAISAARYKVYEDEVGESDYYAENPALRIGMKFEDRAMRLVVKQPIASSNEDEEQNKETRAKALSDSPTRYRTSEASLRLIGAGYGNRILTTTSEPDMRADGNRFTYQHQLKNSAISHQASAIRERSNHASRITHHASRMADDQPAIHNPQSAIEEWYINTASGIEHGFTLNNPPMKREGDEALQVEMEFGGEFKLKANADGKGLILTDSEGRKVSYDHLKVTDATGKELESWMKVRGRRVSIEVSDLEAEYPVTIDPVFEPVTKLTASDGAANDSFGSSVSISGDTVVVGAIGDDSFRGSAYVFERNQGGADNWGEVTKLTASDGEAGDLFGASASISGDTILVGARGDDTSRGSAYLYVNECDNWVERDKQTASDGTTFDHFGWSVSISGDTVVVGAFGDDDAGMGSGSAYVYERNEGGADNWGEVTKLSASDGEADDSFGLSGSISGDTILVGAQGDDSSRGSSYIFSVNCPPLIATNSVSLSQDSSLLSAQIATVSNDITSASSLIISIESAPSGITLTNLTNVDGMITADISADCSASIGANTVTLSVMDEHGLVTMADLTVNVSPEMTPPVINCPADIMTGTDKGQCSAVVNYTATAKDGCDGAITPVCTPASGSTFPVGTTTVTCLATDAAGNSSSCSFNVTVNDTQTPTIVCPANITAKTAAVGNPNVTVNYPAPAADNCGLASVVCNPPSGSAFPLGTTTVTCIATDTSANSVQCSFTVSVFDVCIEDNNDPSKSMLFISTGPLAGTYRICCGGQTLTGQGTVGLKSGILSLTHFTSERRVQGFLYMNQQRGTAALQSPPTAFPCAINDSNTTNNVCACAGG